MINVLAIKTFSLMAERMLLKNLTLLFDQQCPNVVPFVYVCINILKFLPLNLTRCPYLEFTLK
jgi:hypothetical protein